ncbi:hypothetical protein GCM10009127_11660 [Alteraurantiacibacter aestuarii]|uniref:Uncharacterized protein n=1 Tax=Alteraurantiacibacter aestuarii TaxID=650004 RepID=A0A844ZJC7_9SPHN|nr:hypothetical protein [Alteraurantiacibacter aestuarii]MXO87553.1 hypothetical protein [Alteraurantiacibacter aestuarii]
MITLLAPMLLAAASAQAAQGGEPVQTVDPCEIEGMCRTITQFSFETPDGEVVEVDADITLPFLSQGNVMITPGEAITIELVEVEGLLVPFLISTGAASRDGSLAENQISFSLSAVERGQIMLTVLSKYPAALDYAALKVAIGAGPERTSVCTLLPGVAVFEQWQEPIYQMALWGFRKTDDHGCKIIDPEAEPSQTA